MRRMDELSHQLAAFGEEVHAVVIPEIRQTQRRLASQKQDKAQ